MRLIKYISVTLALAALAASAYFVKEGDTLWDISDEYLNDPFAWPDLWENNKHIQDPHWIYPGDSIYLGSAPDTSVKPEPKKPSAPCATAAPDSTLPKGVSIPNGCLGDENNNFAKKLGKLANDSSHQKQKRLARKGTSYFYSQRAQPKLFNGYYQILAPVVTHPDSLKADPDWFTIRSGEKREPLVHTVEKEVVVGIGMNTPQKAKVGDMVEIWDTRRVDLPKTKIRAKEDGAILRFAGLARITDVGDTLSRAIIIQTMREIKMEYAKARLQKPFAPINVNGYSRIQSVAVKDMALIRYTLGKNLVIGPYEYVLIDQGSDNGYALGDGVAIWEKDRSDSLIPPRLLARGLVTSLSNEKAIILIRESYYSDRRIEFGNLVSITHKVQLAK
ncbi:LysM peptidoglycan-binding domain-containing protein [Fibrobacter intestinalis]|uniref:LysM domain-containing protein n=1 Tax=Fibrobacter intestinalis TaxID=28122 RepID=A0A1T4PQ05_9BACT|nr:MULTISPECIES: LysM domain-containing protein [Fibrobacter]PBC72791.1 LysM domain-containing protein [Fibrobacter sp. NR9]SJZ93662.1 LysM domain-containing protein [Fibrobacter intestinalis]